MYTIRIALMSLLLTVVLVSACRTTRSNTGAYDLSKHTLQWEGYERTYYVYTPAGDHSGPLPLLFHLHGGGGNAQSNMRGTFHRFHELADRDGFIIVYPEAVEKNWNDGRYSDRILSWRENIDDVGFIVAVLNEVAGRQAVDRSRVFTTGISNGGFMSSRLLCDRADVFRGGAILTASLSEDYLPQCEPSENVGVLVMNGTDDPLVPYDGGEVRVLGQTRGRIISTDELVTFWQARNGCQTTPSVANLPDLEDDGTRIRRSEYEACAAGGALVLYTVEGGGHTWPGGRQYLGERAIGKTSRDIVACDVIWDFFQTLD